ncbi:hypothetical protein G9A89_000241 [Geosiphon pyriformis]|nr:hypothetical protein G9A89_000241 [Geosiphon pyriformis]
MVEERRPRGGDEYVWYSYELHSMRGGGETIKGDMKYHEGIPTGLPAFRTVSHIATLYSFIRWQTGYPGMEILDFRLLCTWHIHGDRVHGSHIYIEIVPVRIWSRLLMKTDA